MDQYGNVALSEERDVEALASGSAIGASTVNVHLGSASFYLIDQVPEVVSISLLDSFGTGLNVASTQSVTFVAGLTRGISTINFQLLTHILGFVNQATQVDAQLVQLVLANSELNSIKALTGLAKIGRAHV